MSNMTMREHYTAIVVGCGPAGIMAARSAAARGPVLLIDAMKLPRNKSCGGMLNEYAQAFIKDELKAKVPASILSDPKWIRFRFFDWDRNLRRATKLTFENVDRAGFDDWLMQFLPDNVTVRDNTRLIYCTQTRDTVAVQMRPADDAQGAVRTATCDYLIGADGPMTEVRKHIPVSQLKHYKTIQDYLPLKEGIEPYFDCLYARGIGKAYGYGYIIPKGDVAILGSVFFPGSKNVKALHEKALELFSSYYPYEHETRRREAWSAINVVTVDDIVGGYGRVLLAGEAGGIFSPSSGEGISFAMNSGKLAGQAVTQARENAIILEKRDYTPAEESEALRLYRASLVPIKRNIARRLKLFPVLNSNWGKWLGGNMPDKLVDRLAHVI